jgi:hypothetical protein
MVFRTVRPKQWLQDPSQVNGGNARREGNRLFRNKKREFLIDKIEKFATKNKNITDLYRRVNKFKRGYQTRSGSRCSDWIWAERPRGRSLSPGGGQEFLLLHVVQTGPGVHPTSYPMGTGGSFLGVKRPGREADHSLPTSAEVMKMRIYTSTLPYAFMA